MSARAQRLLEPTRARALDRRLCDVADRQYRGENGRAVDRVFEPAVTDHVLNALDHYEERRQRRLAQGGSPGLFDWLSGRTSTAPPLSDSERAALRFGRPLRLELRAADSATLRVDVTVTPLPEDDDEAAASREL